MYHQPLTNKYLLGIDGDIRAFISYARDCLYRAKNNSAEKMIHLDAADYWVKKAEHYIKVKGNYETDRR